MKELNISPECGMRKEGERESLLCKISNPRVTANYLSYGYDYFDNESMGYGYGGYKYDGRYKHFVNKMISTFKIKKSDSVLEIGCAKGYILYEFLKLGFYNINGLDISKYAIDNSHPEIRTKLKNKSAKYLCKLRSKTFDFIYSKEMLPHMCLQDIKKCIKECNRISKIKQNIYFIIQSVKEPKKQLAEKWDPTQKVLMTRSEWVKLLKQNNYHGSYCIKSQF
jgi:ubiquinone/menaquinone biosynthesis C-methylase UbiE